MKHLSFKKKIFSSIFLFIGLNIFITIGFFAFVFSPNFFKMGVKSTNYIEEQLIYIKSNLNEDTNIESFFDDLSDKKKIEIRLKDQNDQIIYNNLRNEKSLFSTSELIEVGEEVYLLTIVNHNKALGGTILINYIIFQVIIFIILYVPVLFISNKKILNPIDNIIKDIKDYKFGIKPVKKNVSNVTDIGKIQNEFIALVDNLEEEKAKQNRIIASISHDIKTPLTTIIGYTDRLKVAKLTKESKLKYIDKIYNKSLVMKDIIESFDDYLSHNITNELKLDVIFVNELLEKVESGFKEDLKEKNIELEITVNNINEIVKIDVSKFMRVFSNIIGNSVRYIKCNGKIKISVEIEEKNIVFTINDNGGGIKESIKEQIFEPLFTTDKSRKISGLGLSICKEIVLIHGGQIEAFNENDGLSIRFSIPIYYS